MNATDVQINENTFTVKLIDGRELAVPLDWFPRLQHGTPEERNHWNFLAKGEGIHWPELDEDISVEDLVLGKRSIESQSSIGKWLTKRNKNAV
ncbi:MAG: DUF2442 domain-containing protein [Candidatus Hinthialibacter antarcticus]|nr:DUF2442 domain-containing protein [Candidatus Hinthialibacter antarcticus]